MKPEEILAYCDHTLLRPEAGGKAMMNLCDEAMRAHPASICIPPCHVAGARAYTEGAVKICTVIGFPNGYSSPRVKAFEAQDAIRNGADEIDMVANIAMIKDGCYEDVLDELRMVRGFTTGHVLKVIIETCLLTEEEKRLMCEVVAASGADYIKTSTGFSAGGATREDVALLRECCPDTLKIKAAGGIRTIEDAVDFINLGADRLGTSALVPLILKMMDESAEK